MHVYLSVFYCMLFVGVMVVLALGVYAVFRHSKAAQPHGGNEYAGFMFGTIGVIYSLLIAFVIVAVWEDYEELNQTIMRETDKLSGLIIHAAVLPDSVRIPVNRSVAQYCNGVVSAWDDPKAASMQVGHALADLRVLLLHTTPQNHLQEKVLDILDDNLDAIGDHRRERLDHVRSHVPALVWIMVFASSVMLIVFSFLIETASSRLKRTGIAFLTALIAMSISLVYAFDHPFSVGTGISSEPYQQLLRQLHSK